MRILMVLKKWRIFNYDKETLNNKDIFDLG